MGGDFGRIAAGVGTFGASELANQATGGKLFDGGLGGGKGGAPQAPDFKGAAEAQAASSRQATDAQTRANRVNQTNAFGSTNSWEQGPNGQWTQTQSLGGPLGGAADALSGQVAANAGTPLDNGSSVRQQAIDATYGQAASRLDPRFAQAEESQRSQLLNQGLDPGSQAYDTAAGNLSREKNDAYTSAMNTAVQTGNQAQALTFGENMAARQEPMNELGQLRAFTQMPDFAQAGAAQPTQYLPAAAAQYGGQMQQYGIDQQSKNSKMQGGASLGGAAMLASDERLKTDIVRSDLEAIPGVPFASWEWRDGSGRGFGVVAQDVEKVRPDLIGWRADGYRMVNYGALLGAR